MGKTMDQAQFKNFFRVYCQQQKNAGRCNPDRDCDFCCVAKAYEKIFEEETE